MVASGSVSETFLYFPVWRPCFSASWSGGLVRAIDLVDVTLHKALPADVGADQGGVDVNDLADGDLGGHTGLHGALEDAPEALGAPALPDAGQRGVVRPCLMQAVAHEPTDGEVDLRLAHQTPVVDQAEQEPGQHQPNRRLRVNPRPAVVGTVEISHLIPQPREIEHAIHTGEDVIVGHKLAQGTSDKQLQLIALLAPQHRSPRSSSLPQGNQSAAPAAKGLSARNALARVQPKQRQ